MRRQFICGNWKMFGSIAEATALVTAVRERIEPISGIEVGVAPPFPHLPAVRQVLNGSSIRLAGQNCHWENQGAFTGEVSPTMLWDVGCDSAIVGHSERRQYFGETDAVVNKRARAALAAGLTPIICVGETLSQRQAGETLSVVERQVRGCLDGFDAAAIGGVVIAYEPVWAIGTGQVATAAQAQEVHAAIRGWLAGLAGAEVANIVRILYGGSVKGPIAAELLAQPDIDGALVGGASLNADEFARIVRSGKRPPS